MKIAIVSDIHGNMAYLGKAKSIINRERIKTVICCGDIQDEEVFFELDSWSQKVYLVLGNADIDLGHKLADGLITPKNLKYFQRIGRCRIESKEIAFCHDKTEAIKLASQSTYDLVFYGHTHLPWEEKIGRTVLTNPGEITAQFGKSTFAIFDLTKMKARLVILK